MENDTNTTSITVDCYGFSGMVINGLPTSVEQFDAMAGRAGAALDAAIDNFVAHSHLTRVRKTLVEKLEASTGIARKRDGKKYSETESAYIKRLESELGEALWTDHRAAADEAFSETEVSLAKMARSSGISSANVAKKYMDAADKLLAAGKVASFLAKFAPTIELASIVDNGAWATEDSQKILGNEMKKVSLEAERTAREQAAAAIAAL